MSIAVSYWSTPKWRVVWKCRHTRVTIPILFFALTGILAGAPASAQEANEPQVKAAFLFHFAKFVEWPPEAFNNVDAPIIVGLVGEDSTSSAIDQTISDKSANGRRLLIKRFANFRTITHCHILFISSSQSDNVRQILAAAGPAVLTVGETEQFADKGGIINFTIVDKKVRFEINQTAAEKAGLRISAKLLSLARAVR